MPTRRRSCSWLAEGERGSTTYAPRCFSKKKKKKKQSGGMAGAMWSMSLTDTPQAKKPSRQCRTTSTSRSISPRFFRRQTETPRLRQEVVDAGRATVVADGQPQVAPLQADHGCGHEVVGRRQPPSLLPAQQRMIARMIIVVGHGGIEDHPLNSSAQSASGLSDHRRRSSAINGQDQRSRARWLSPRSSTVGQVP